MAGVVSEEASPTAIVAAMDEEMSSLRARLTRARAVVVPGARVMAGWLGGAPVALAVTGDGAHNARLGLTGLLAALRVSRVIAVGVAGGLSNDLDVGALVVGARVIGEVEGSLHGADPALTARVAVACGARRGVALTAGRIADTVDEKRRLMALALARAPDPDGATALAAVVDLESAAFAAVAERAGIPWTVLRAVSDRADEAVPALLNRSRDAGGSVRRGRVARGLLADPSALLPLLALGRRVRECADLFANALERALCA